MRRGEQRHVFCHHLIDDEWMREHPAVRLHRDWGGYGILAPDLREG